MYSTAVLHVHAGNNMYICTRWLYITCGNGLFSHRCPADVLHVRCGAQIYMASAGVGVSRSEGRQHSCEIHAQTLLEFHRRLGHPALGWVHIARRRWKSRRAFSSHCTCIALNRSYVHMYTICVHTIHTYTYVTYTCKCIHRHTYTHAGVNVRSCTHTYICGSAIRLPTNDNLGILQQIAERGDVAVAIIFNYTDDIEGVARQFEWADDIIEMECRRDDYFHSHTPLLNNSNCMWLDHSSMRSQ